jgi:hypothetical protein
MPVRGERLTVTLVENGREKTVVIPKNQVFRYGTAPKETTQQITSVSPSIRTSLTGRL